MAGIAEGQEVQPQDLPRLRSAEGLVTLVGFGSLLSERSARTTFPDLSNLRLGRLVGWRRVFAHVAPIFFERGIANVETREMSSLSVEPCPGARCVVSLFEAPMSDEQLAAYVEREHEFRFVAVRPTGLDGSQVRLCNDSQPAAYSTPLATSCNDTGFCTPTTPNSLRMAPR